MPTPKDDTIPTPPLAPPQSQLEEVVREHPLAAIFAAAIIGLLIGKVVL
jgi:hypothetical protein